jgi:hypothetical protein
LRQAKFWSKDKNALNSLSTFLFKLFEDANKLDPGLISIENSDAINRYRPLERSRDFIPEYLNRFDEYRLEAINENNKAKVNLTKTALRLILEASTLKDTLKPLRFRLKSRTSYDCPINKRISFHPTFRNHDMSLQSEHKESYINCIEHAITNIIYKNQKLQEKEYIDYTAQLCKGIGDDEPQILFNTNIGPRKQDKLTLFNQSLQKLNEFKQLFWKSFCLKQHDENEHYDD